MGRLIQSLRTPAKEITSYNMKIAIKTRDMPRNANEQLETTRQKRSLPHLIQQGKGSKIIVY